MGLREARHQVRATIGPGARRPTSSDRFLAGNPDDARMAVVGIDTVAIVVADRRRAIAWYRDVLGLPVAFIGPPDSAPDTEGTPDDPGHWIELGPRRPQTRVHLCELRGNTEPGPSGITFLTTDIHADYERMKAKGVAFKSPPTRMDWGEWLCEFEDPDGNGFDLKQPASTAE